MRSVYDTISTSDDAMPERKKTWLRVIAAAFGLLFAACSFYALHSYPVYTVLHESLFGVPPTYQCKAPLKEGVRCTNSSHGGKRIFDIRLYSHESDYEMRPLVIEEIGSCVDAIIFVQTPFEFGHGTPKPVTFGNDGKSTDFVIGSTVEDKEALATCAKITEHTHYTVSKANFAKTPGSWCRQSLARNAMGRAFVEAGGRDGDLVLISDADEIPRAEVLQMLKHCPPTDGLVLKLESIHNFRYHVGCERSGSIHHHRGPAMLTGRTLRRFGAQAIRTVDGCEPVGFSATCTQTSRRLVRNGSWHLSSFSGGPKGQVIKYEQGFDPMGEGSSFAQLAKDMSVIAGECKEPMGKKKTSITFDKMQWTVANPPRYPDIPHALERRIGQGEMLRMIEWKPEDFDFEGVVLRQK